MTQEQRRDLRAEIRELGLRVKAREGPTVAAREVKQEGARTTYEKSVRTIEAQLSAARKQSAALSKVQRALKGAV